MLSKLHDIKTADRFEAVNGVLCYKLVQKDLSLILMQVS